MVVFFSTTNCLNPGLISPRSKLLLPQSLHLLSATRPKSSIHLCFPANRIRHGHITNSSPPSSGTTVLEDQLQPQSEDNEVESSTEVALEVKQVQRERKEREQQWSELGKMVGTAGVVLAVIAGSVAALLSVNAILAELSDKVFDGRIKLQDFF